MLHKKKSFVCKYIHKQPLTGALLSEIGIKKDQFPKYGKYFPCSDRQFFTFATSKKTTKQKRWKRFFQKGHGDQNGLESQ